MAIGGALTAATGSCATVGRFAGGRFAVSATTGGMTVVGFSAGRTGDGFIGGFAMATARRPEAGRFFAAMITGWSVLTTEEAAKTIAHTKSGDCQRIDDIERKAPAFARKLCVRAV